MESKKRLAKGKIVKEGERYFVLVDQVKHELPLNVIPEKNIKLLVGKDVEVEYSNPIVHITGVFGTGAVRPPRIICYIPVPDFNPLVIDAIAQYERIQLVANQLLEEKVITKEIHAKLLGKTVQ